MPLHAPASVEPVSSRPWQSGLFVLLALAVLVMLWLAFGAPTALEWGDWRNHLDQLEAVIRAHPLLASLLVFALHALLAATALPGASVLMLAAGAGFGAFWGTVICLAGCTAGASVSMLAARYWLRPWVSRRYATYLTEFDRRIAADGAHYLLSLRLLPVLPFVVVNLAAGLSRMGTWLFTWVSFVGMAAGTFVYAYAGAQLGQVRELSDLYSLQTIGTLAVLAVLPWLARAAARTRFGKSAKAS